MIFFFFGIPFCRKKKNEKKKEVITIKNTMSLLRYLSEFYVKDGKDATHGSIEPPGRYHVDNLKQFTMYYMKALQTNEKLSITELQNDFDFIPLILDIDLNIIISEDELRGPSLYSKEHVQNIYKALISVMKRIFLDELTEENMKCFLMERDGYEVKKKKGRVWKHGFHLHFPYLLMNRKHIKTYFLPQFIKYLKDYEIEIPECVEYEKLIDDSIYAGKGKPWFLYGSTKPMKNLDLKPYLVSGVFYEDGGGEINYSDEWLPHLLSYKLIYTSHHNNLKQLNDNCLSEIFSIRKDDNHESYIFEIDERCIEIENDDESLNSTLVRTNSFEYQEVTVTFFDQLLEALPNEYAEEYDKWKQIGWVIYNHFDGSLDGFQRFDEFSKLCPEKYNYEDCMKEWNMMKRSDKEVSIGTLRYLVRKHKPLEYNTICNQNIDSIVSQTLSKPISHYDLAKILHDEFAYTYCCSSVKHNDWYRFDGIIWTKDEDSVTLRNQISTFLAGKYEKILQSLLSEEKDSLDKTIYDLESQIENETCNINQYKKLHNTVSFNEKSNLEKSMQIIQKKIDKLKDKLYDYQQKRRNPVNKPDARKVKKGDNDETIEKLYKIIACLKSSPFKKHVMTEAKDIFYDKNFARKLNQSIYKVAFANGIYDLENNIFREGVPSDLISLKMDVKYRQDFTDDSPEVKQIDDFFEKVFPDEHLRRYFLGLQSENFVGRNMRKIFQMWVGVGDNAKSITQSMFEKLLGPYCQILPTALLTQKRSASSSASPELVRAGEGCRLCFFKEADKTEKFNVGLLKELTGNDRFFARPLFREPIDITPQFKLILTSNHPPIVENSQNDKAIFNRVRIIPFQSYFPPNDAEVPKTEEERKRQKIFYRDVHFDDKIPSLLEALAYRLIKIYTTGQNKVPEPLCVMQATENYRHKCNRIALFIEDEINEDSPGKSIDIKQFLEKFSDYCKNDLSGAKPTNRVEIVEYLDGRWGPRDADQRYHNVEFKN